MNKKVLNIVGLGIKGTEHLTLEAISKIESAKKVLYLPISPRGVESFLKSKTEAPVESLKSLYESDAVDIDNYQRLQNKILNDVEEFGEVCLLLPGHPRLGVTLVQWLEARENDFELQVLPGVCSFDTIINDLKKDPIERGSVILDANRLLLLDYQLESCMDHYIYHVCSIGTSKVYVDEPQTDNQISLLKAHLLKFFSEDHPVKLVSSSVESTHEPFIRETRLSELESLLSDIHFGTTLFIPGSQPNRISKEYLYLLKPELKKKAS